MGLLRRRTALLAKVETTYGVDPSPSTSADAVIVENFSWTYPTEIDDPEAAAGSISPQAHVVLRRTAEITFQVPIRGSGTPGTAPDFSPLIRACGFGETIDAGVSVTYQPVSTDIKSITIYAYVDGKLWEFNGCRGNVVFQFQASDKLRMEFTFIGQPVAPIDEAFPSISGTDTTTALRVESASFTFGGVALAVAGVSVDMQNSIEFSDDINNANSLGEAVLGSRLPLGNINPEETLNTTYNAYSVWTAGTEQALSMQFNGGAGNIIDFDVPAAIIRELQPGDRGGNLIHEIPFTCKGEDDEVQLVLT